MSRKGIGKISIPAGGFTWLRYWSARSLFFLDGSISGNLLLDLSGNSRHFTITDNDFSADWTYGIPYKSMATVSAPIGDAVLIAADINNFLYSAGGVPNEIPVIAFFQDIDYENVIFCKHDAQVIDGNGVETFEPRVHEIFMSNSGALVGGILLTAQSYFEVPAIDASAYWIDPVGGNDGNNGTTKALAWKTIQHAEDQAVINNKTVYIMTGEEDLTSLWVDDFTVDWTAIGNFIINDNEQARVLRCNTASSYTGIYFKETGANDDVVLNYGAGATFTKCKFSGGTNAWRMSAFADTNMTYCLSGRYRIMAVNVTVNINTCYNVFTGFQNNTGSIITTINSYAAVEEKIYQNIDSLTIKGNTYLGLSCVTQQNNNLTGDVNISYSKFYPDQNSAGLIYPVVGKNMTFTYNATHNSIFDNGYDSILLSNGALINAIITDNNCLNVGGGDLALGISGDYDGIVSVLEIKRNEINKREGIGAIIGLGNDNVAGAIGDLDGSVIENNILRGPDYFGNEGTGSHSILIINQQEIPVRYNRLYDNQLGIVIKNEHALAQSFVNGVVSYNVVETPLLSRGMEFVKFYNNTVVLGYIHLLETDGTLTQAQNCEIKNNIIINNIPIIVDDDSEVGLVCDYNIYYGPGGALSFRYKGVTKNFAEWQLLGYDLNSIVLTEAQYNELFTDADNNVYSLKTGSQAIGNGVNLGVTYDDGLDESHIFGEPKVTKQQTVPWDIGAYIS